MSDRLPAADLRTMVAALRAERTELLTFTSALSGDEWAAPSAAKGWRIADVVAHIGATAGNMYDLGRFPLGLLIGGALVFDHHTHLRHDLAPALGGPVPPTDAARMRAVLTWMIAVLNNQVARAPVAGLDARVALTLTGPGGGTWWIDEAGVLPPASGPVAAHVTAPAATFPDWGTQRSGWRDSAVTTTGDTDLAARFLHSVNII